MICSRLTGIAHVTCIIVSRQYSIPFQIQTRKLTYRWQPHA